LAIQLFASGRAADYDIAWRLDDDAGVAVSVEQQIMHKHVLAE
jgi:hypothetical protein